MKRFFRWFLILLLIHLLLPVFVALILYHPLVQHTLAGLGERWVERYTDYSVHIGNMRLYFPLRLHFEDISLTLKDDDDTTVEMSMLDFSVNPRPLFEKRVEAPYLIVRGIEVHTGDMSADMEIDGYVDDFRLYDLSYGFLHQGVDIREVSFSGGNVSVIDSNMVSKPRENTFSFPLSLSVGDCYFNDIDVNLCNGEKSFLVDVNRLACSELCVEPVLSVHLQQMQLSGGSLRVCSLPEFNDPLADKWNVTNLAMCVDSVIYTSPSDSAQLCFKAVLSTLSFNESYGFGLRDGTLSCLCEDGEIQLFNMKFVTDASTITGSMQVGDYGNDIYSMPLTADLNIEIGRSDAFRALSLTKNLPGSFFQFYPDKPLMLSLDLEGNIGDLQLCDGRVSLDSAFDFAFSGEAKNITDPLSSRAVLRLTGLMDNTEFIKMSMDSVGQQILMPDHILCSAELYYVPDSLLGLLSLESSVGALEMSMEYCLSRQYYSAVLSADAINLRSVFPLQSIGVVSLQAEIDGVGWDFMEPIASLDCLLWIDSLVWNGYTFYNGRFMISLYDGDLFVEGVCADTLVDFRLRTFVNYSPYHVKGEIYADVVNVDMQALGLSDTMLHPSGQCTFSFKADTSGVYMLHGGCYDLFLVTSQQTIHPHPLDISIWLARDSLSVNLNSGDMLIEASIPAAGYPWEWRTLSDTLLWGKMMDGAQIRVDMGTDNTISNYLSLFDVNLSHLFVQMDGRANSLSATCQLSDLSMRGVEVDNISLLANYTSDGLKAEFNTSNILWNTTTMQLLGRLKGRVWCERKVSIDDLLGVLYVEDLNYTFPQYGLSLYAKDSVSIPLRGGTLFFEHVPIRADGGQPLWIDGWVKLLGGTPSIQLVVDTRGVSLIDSHKGPNVLLYGKLLVDGKVSLSGPINNLSIKGGVTLRTGTSLHYIYKNATLVSTDRLAEVVTFTDFTASMPSVEPKRGWSGSALNMNLQVSVEPSVQLKVQLGASDSNAMTLQGGGILNAQLVPGTGFRLSGRYVVSSGELIVNIPLLHVHTMTVRPGSSLQWSGNALNPILDIVIENRVKTTVTIDDAPQSVLFVTGITLADTMERLSMKFTLEAPENASMQNSLATMSPDERSKLAVALLTTGLYLGEGGTGNLMNAALMGFLQSQIDDISRDAFRSVDVSFGIEPLADGVNGISTRKDYSFSVSKRFWNDRVRVTIGGSVTTANERIQSDAIIDNISVEWRLSGNGNRYIRLFYDRNYESILEGMIREAGVGYVFRKQF